MLRVEGEMRPSLRKMPLVREQRALALKWSGTRSGQELALRLLRSVLDELGPNAETCGHLGSVCKARWMATRSGDRAEKERRLDEAIHWYQQGMCGPLLDPYPGVNVLTLLAVKGTDSAMEEHGRLLPEIELAILRRLHRRPGYWDLVAMVELAANRCDRNACDFYLRMALAAPYESWQLRTAATNLRLLLKAPAPEFRSAAPWLRSAIRSLARGRLEPPGEGE